MESTQIPDNQREGQLSVLSIDEIWSSVELYSRYRRFYEAVIVGVLAYVVEAPSQGIDLVSGYENKGILV